MGQTAAMTDSRTTPSQSIAAECQRRGAAGVVSGCIDLLEAREADDALVLALGGEPAPYVLSGGEGGRQGHWPRVWAARGLLYVWEDRATPAIVRAAADEAWRVREMAAKVIARHQVDDGAGGRHRAARRPGRAGPLGRGPGHRPADGQRALS